MTKIERHEYLQVVSWYNRTEPTQITTDTLDYILSNPQCLEYSYKLYKQPGLKEYNIDLIMMKKIWFLIELNKISSILDNS